MEEPAARQPHKAQLRPHPAPWQSTGPLSVPPVTSQTGYHLSSIPGKGREFWGGAGSPMILWLELERGRSNLVCPPCPTPRLSQRPLIPPLPKVGDSSPQGPQETARCPAHILHPPFLIHLFPFSVCGLSTGKEKPIPSLCAGSQFGVKWGP